MRLCCDTFKAGCDHDSSMQLSGRALPEMVLNPSSALTGSAPDGERAREAIMSEGA